MAGLSLASLPRLQPEGKGGPRGTVLPEGTTRPGSWSPDGTGGDRGGLGGVPGGFGAMVPFRPRSEALAAEGPPGYPG